MPGSSLRPLPLLVRPRHHHLSQTAAQVMLLRNQGSEYQLQHTGHSNQMPLIRQGLGGQASYLAPTSKKKQQEIQTTIWLWELNIDTDDCNYLSLHRLRWVGTHASGFSAHALPIILLLTAAANWVAITWPTFDIFSVSRHTILWDGSLSYKPHITDKMGWKFTQWHNACIHKAWAPFPSSRPYCFGCLFFLI